MHHLVRGLALAATLILAGCAGGTTAPPPSNPTWQPSTAASAWSIRYSPGQPAHPAAGWVLAFPVGSGCPGSGCQAVHYVTTAAGGRLTGAKSVTMTFKVTTTGGAQFGFKTAADNTGTSPAAVRLLLQRAGDDGLSHDTYRFWSNPQHVDLADGTFTLTVPLTPDQWSSVNGHMGNTVAAGFADTLANLGNIGFTLGGGSFFGHGVFITGGTATLTLLGYTVQR